ncbi:hypothetical protein BHE74_00032941, partial [Ensete ventricosum]
KKYCEQKKKKTKKKKKKKKKTKKKKKKHGGDQCPGPRRLGPERALAIVKAGDSVEWWP